jgi:hypothetical protein
MELQTLLERVEPSRLKQLGTLLSLGEGLSKHELVDWVSQELPFCQVEEDGACVGIDGAFYIAVDWVNDMTTLELLRETDWSRREPSGRTVKFVVTEEAIDLSLKDARMLLALLSVATYGDAELPIPGELSGSHFSRVLHAEEIKSKAFRPSSRPSQIPPASSESRRPSIPPGFSQTFDSMRPVRQSVRPSSSIGAMPSDDEDGIITVEPELIEYVLTLPRHSLLAAAFALAERGARSHSVCLGRSGRAVISRDTLEAAQRLFEDHRDSAPPPANQDALLAYRKRLTTSFTYFGIPKPDASALVDITLEESKFPMFYSDQSPPEPGIVKRELAGAPEDLATPILQLMFDCFYCKQLADANELQNQVQAVHSC